MLSPDLSTPAVCGVLILIVFLSYSSQYLFCYVDPGRLTLSQALVFNILVASLLLCYARACLTDPGSVPSDYRVKDGRGRRWCKKCNNWKPPRAHHCKVCKKCILKMDHHCPWTINCVSHRTFPHFLRFIFYAVAAMSQLEGFLYTRAKELWANRYMPYYFGPSKLQLAHLFILMILNTLTLFALLILLVRSLWCLGANTTTIEGWEIERHEALLKRSRINGGYVHGPNGIDIKIQRQEFPYDIGIYWNVAQGMGSRNPIVWFWPLSTSPSVGTGLEFEENDFNEPGLSWPPPDPDRMSFRTQQSDREQPIKVSALTESDADRVEAFKARQRADLKRWTLTGEHELRQRQRHGPGQSADSCPDLEDVDFTGSSIDGEHWTNSEGERLADFGIDEDAEFDDGDNVPLSQLLANRRSVD